MPPALIAVAQAAIAFAAVEAGIIVTTLTAFQFAAVTFVSSLALGFVTKALTPKPPRAEAPSFDRQAQDNVLTVRQAAAPRIMGFGRARVGGVYTFLHTTGSDNSVLHSVVTVTGHSVRSFDALYLDDEIVPLDANGDATGKYAGKVTAKFGLGTTAGDVDFNAALTAAVGSDMWGANHRQSGCAKAYVKFIFDNDLFGGGLPNPSFVVSAYDAVEDPRFATSPVTTGWTDNAALCLAQYHRDTARGLGYASADINEAALIAAANDSDEMVTRVSAAVTFTADATTDVLTLTDTSAKLRTGTRFQVSSNVSPETLPGGLSSGVNYFWDALTPTTGRVATSLANSRSQTYVNLTSAGSGTLTLTVNAEPRYTLNGWIDTSEDPEQIVPRLLAAMAGTKTESGGEVLLFAGVWRAAANSIDEDDLDGPVVSQHRRSKRDLFNAVKGVFVNPDDNWQPTDFPVVAPATYLTEDAGERIFRDAELRFTDSPSMAQRIVRIELEKNRRQQTISMPLTLAGMVHRAADNVLVTNEKRGYVAKTFTVSRWGLELRGQDSDNPRVGTLVDVDEIDANVFAWTPGTDEAQMAASPLTTLPDPFEATAPTGLVLTSGTAVLDVRLDGSIFSRIKAAWTAPADAQVTSGGRIEVEFKKSASATWLDGGSVRGDATEAFILDVKDGVAYDVRIRSRRGGGIQAVSDFVTATNHTVIGKTAAPANVPSITAAQNGAVVVILWERITDLDRNGYIIKYMAAPFVWESATVLTTEAKGTANTEAQLPPGDWVIGIKAIDTSWAGGPANESAAATTTTITVTSGFDVIEEVEQRPSWLGQGAGTSVGFFRNPRTGNLNPRSQDADSTADDVFDEYVVRPVAQPIYEAPEIDLGHDTTARLWAEILANLGPGETGVAAPDLEVDFRAEAGAYDGFEAWSIGDATLRRAKFRLVLDTSEGVARITGFKPVVDAEERSELIDDIVVASSPPGTAVVTFDTPFFATPFIEVFNAGATARIVAHQNASGTGFTFLMFDAAGNPANGTGRAEAIGT